jgi:hypothetical protein
LGQRSTRSAVLNSENGPDDHVESDVPHPRMNRERLPTRKLIDCLVSGGTHHVGIGAHPVSVESRQKQAALMEMRIAVEE